MKFSDTKYGDLTGQIYEGNIDVSGVGLTSLEGAPKEVHGGFYCSGNQLTSLEFSPKEVDGIFCCSYNKIRSLDGLPLHKGIVSDFSDSEIDEYYKVNFPQYLI